MTHAPNPKYAPPLKSAAEYEREIQQLTKQSDECKHGVRPPHYCLTCAVPDYRDERIAELEAKVEELIAGQGAEALTLAQQGMIVMLALLASIGAAGIPSAGLDDLHQHAKKTGEDA